MTVEITSSGHYQTHDKPWTLLRFSSLNDTWVMIAMENLRGGLIHAPLYCNILQEEADARSDH